MTDADTPQRRRREDRQMAEFGTRLTVVERDISSVLKSQERLAEKLDGIRADMADPASSPVGRRLSERADANAAGIARLNAEVASLNASRSEMVGAAKTARMVQLLLGVAIAIVTLLQVANRP